MKKKKKIDKYLLPSKCPYCKGKNIKLYTHIEFYGREFHKDGKLYVCEDCKARVGCHKGTDIAFGKLGDDELRKLKADIHNIIDKLWKTPEERKNVYRRMAVKYPFYKEKFHIGFLNNEQARWILYDLKNQYH